jgi:hypothetical protein
VFEDAGSVTCASKKGLSVTIIKMSPVSLYRLGTRKPLDMDRLKAEKINGKIWPKAERLLLYSK